MGPEKPTTEETVQVDAGPVISPVFSGPSIVSTGPVLDAPFNGALQPVDPKAIDQGSLLDEVSDNVPIGDLPFSKDRFARQRLFGFGLLLFGCLAIALLGLRIESNKTKAQEASLASPSARFQQQQVSISSLNKQLGTVNAVAAGNVVTVNGSLVLTPTMQPSDPVAGQLFYNQSANQVQYYDGTGFVRLQGGVTNNIYNTSSTANNTYNTSNVTNNIGATFTGTPGALAMFGAGGNTLADSLVTQSGSIVNVATTGTDTVNVGSGASTGTTVVQGGTGGMSLLTGAATGASGTITIQSGDSSTTSSGNVSVDTGVNSITGTLVEDHTYESGTEGMGDGFGYLDSYAQSSAQAHSGTYSLAVTSGNGQYGGGGNPSWLAADAIPLRAPAVAGDNYALSAWIRANTNARVVQCDVWWSSDGYGGGGEIEDDQWCTVTDSSSQWKHVSGTVTAPPGASSVGVNFSGYNTPAGEVTYIDDVTVTDVSSSPTNSQLNLGANNAQQVTIGNTSQTSATTIYGHGLTLNGGQSADSISGGSIDLSSKNTITLTGGSSSGSGVIVNSLAPTTTAFQVQGNGLDLLTVDSTDKAVNLGVGAGNSIGYSKIGSHTDGGTGINTISATKLTTTSGGTIGSMSAYFGGTYLPAPNNQYGFAIYADNSGQPGAYIASSNTGTFGASGTWQSLPVSATLAANTNYWLVYWQNSNLASPKNGINYDIGLSSAVTVDNTFVWLSGSDNGWPATFPTTGLSTVTGMKMSIYATFTTTSPAVTVDRYGTLTQSGAALFQDPTDSTQAFQVENSLGNTLLAANTASMTINLGGAVVVAGDITVNGHIVTGGSSPTITAGTAACTTPTVSIAGTDTTGTVTITTGTGCVGGGTLATITFASAFANNPNVTLTPANASASALQYYNGTSVGADFTVDTNNTPVGSTTYKWHYWAAQ